jgi:HKD family nuclease
MKVEKKLIVNSAKGNLLNELIQSINECERFYFSVAFINFSGLQLLLEAIKEAQSKGINGKILTSTYLNFTEVKALLKINEFLINK